MSALKIYNTLAREKQLFSPMQAGKVRMYVCGMTIYDYCHIGHARMMMAFDVAYRWLKASGYEVNYVRNITDIDDKIIKRAVENGESISQLTSRFTAYMREDTQALGILPPTHEPRATDYVPQMLGLIDVLEKNGLAYKAPDGDVNYSVRDFPGYGKLSGKTLDNLRAGERVDINTGKRDPLDFVLWKASKDSEPEEVKWASKWGSGRPGWHIECSAMACELLGEKFDIHGGGADLQFPHHENEIAQSEGAYQHTFVNYWMHNGFVRVDNEKMSKSLGNFFTIREVLAKYRRAEIVRFFILRAHYRSPLNYSDVHLDDASQALDRLYMALKDVAPDTENLDQSEEHAKRFAEAMNDDFNTPLAISVLFDLAREVNKKKSAMLARQLKKLGDIIGLLQENPKVFLGAVSNVTLPQIIAAGQGHTGQIGSSSVEATFSGRTALNDARIDELIAERMIAKKAKNFGDADRIRAELLAEGIILEDKPDGTTERRRA